MVRLDWEELVKAIRQRPVVAALTSCTVFFCLCGLAALAVGGFQAALGGAMLMTLFYFLTVLANAEA